MTKRFTIVVAARFDARLLEIDDYLARERSEKHAALVTSRILAKVASLVTLPRRGRRVRETDDESVRELLAVDGRYRVIYRVDDERNVVELMTVVHARQQLRVEDLLDD